MPTEHDLTAKIHAEVKRRREAGEPIHGRKIHGSQYMRDHPDWIIVYGGAAIIIETKNPDPQRSSHRVTPGQAVELHRYQGAGALCVVCRSMEEVRATLDRARPVEGAHPLRVAIMSWLTEPLLSVLAWMHK